MHCTRAASAPPGGRCAVEICGFFFVAKTKTFCQLIKLKTSSKSRNRSSSFGHLRQASKTSHSSQSSYEKVELYSRIKRLQLLFVMNKGKWTLIKLSLIVLNLWVFWLTTSTHTFSLLTEKKQTAKLETSERFLTDLCVSLKYPQLQTCDLTSCVSYRWPSNGVFSHLERR